MFLDGTSWCYKTTSAWATSWQGCNSVINERRSSWRRKKSTQKKAILPCTKWTTRRETWEQVGQRRIISSPLSSVKSMVVKLQVRAGWAVLSLTAECDLTSATIRFLPPPHATEGTPLSLLFILQARTLGNVVTCSNHYRSTLYLSDCLPLPVSVCLFVCLSSISQTVLLMNLMERWGKGSKDRAKNFLMISKIAKLLFFSQVVHQSLWRKSGIFIPR